MDHQAILQYADRFLSYWQQDPQNSDLYLQTQEALLNASRFADMAALLLQPPAALQHSAQLAHWQGMHELATGQFAAAEIRFQEWGALHPELLVFRINQAHAQALQSQYAAAIHTLDAIPVTELDETARSLLLRCHYWQGDLETVIRLATAWLRGIHPEDAACAGLLSLALIDDNQLEPALAWARHALQYAPNPEALTAMGLIAMADQQNETAQDWFQRALAQDPRSGRAWLGLGMCAMARLEMKEAEPLLQKAAEHLAGYIGTWHMLGWHAIALQEADKAEAYLLRGLSLNRNFADSHAALAIVDLLRKNLQAAHYKITLALKLDPHSATARYAHSLYLEACGQTEQAQVIVSELLNQTLPIGISLNQAVRNMRPT